VNNGVRTDKSTQILTAVTVAQHNINRKSQTLRCMWLIISNRKWVHFASQIAISMPVCMSGKQADPLQQPGRYSVGG